MSMIIFFVVSFLVQALALKLALSFMGHGTSSNGLGKAMGISFMLNVLLFFVGLVPLLGWVLKPVVWLLVVMSAYNTSFFKSMGVGLTQVVLQWGIGLVLSWLGLSMAFAGM
ncbi:hypothetical protein DL240_16155 [Lujinxingia litoralis]|uniref:Uncharacterized protein n=1 Tax=Lujinxingia litoralis TaxID=2211119 RepID=A0A328C1S0_9DELT|nr:hypothetical protein [Lujinxingia litoralis]RAL20569.1 hypothetical protein DL240_16155 [Lujinxingia litoralis]